MKGFANKAIIIFPRPEVLESKHVSYRERFKSSLNGIILYLKSRNIQPYAIATDELAQSMKHPDIIFMANMSKGDAFFIQNNCAGFGNMDSGVEEFYMEEISKVNQALPVVPRMEVEDRFKIVLKREAKINKEILSKEKVIVNFSAARNPTFKIPASKENDARMIITPNSVSNHIEIQMGGIVISPIDIMGFNGATRPLHLWKESDWLG